MRPPVRLRSCSKNAAPIILGYSTPERSGLLSATGLPGVMVRYPSISTPSRRRCLLRESLQQHAEGVGIVLPVEESGDLRVGVIRKVCVNRADRSADRKLFIEVERPASDDVNRSGDATLDQRSLRTLVYYDLADELRRQQRVADAATDL